MSRHKLIIAIISTAVAVAGVGCGSARRGAPFDEPVVLKSKQLIRGQALYMEKCHQCHPGGAAGLGPAINNKPLPAFLIRTQVRKGFGQMPAFTEAEISDADLEALGRYTLALRRSGD